jgi:hypothetical protein
MTVEYWVLGSEAQKIFENRLGQYALSPRNMTVENLQCFRYEQKILIQVDPIRVVIIDFF